ncbi:SDR family oxidoreductase [Actinoplanes sp. M2I2]|uniref:SDR family oxidoreductase n=1 Tax=Actinoplanes sp. M2I2 TaxID=1734444 RepID=UPI0020202607|nr:SDR family NAD(P)-dependent oxidoreductase [Actinoplanes sp. M2I2]
MNLSGRHILVTGAGTGMGLEAAKRFSSHGCRVIMVARREDRLRAEAAQLPDAVAFPCDLSDTGDVRRLLDFVATEHPSLDTVLLNAGVTHTYRLFGEDDAYAFAEQEVRTNYLSAVQLIDGLVPIIGGQHDPALIVTTSGAAFAPDITNPTYSATKAALHSLTQAVRLQLERNGSPIRVFEFMAPLVDSPFSAGVRSDQKMPLGEAVAELLAGLERDELELRVGGSEDIYQALRQSSDAAVRIVNAATGG